MSPSPDRARQLRSELARHIAAHVGSAEDRATEIPGVTLHRRTAQTAPCSATYEPGVTVIAQGRKRVDLGRTTFVYGESRYLLTSVDLPIVSQIVEASEAPVVASHVGAKHFSNHPQNLSDELLKLVAAKGGLIGVHGHGSFLHQKYWDWRRGLFRDF